MPRNLSYSNPPTTFVLIFSELQILLPTSFFFFLLIRPPPSSPLFPSTTPFRSLAVARAVSVRAVVPRVQEVAVATPLPFVVTGVGGSTVPFAPVALNVTATPATGLPFASFTITDGGEPTAAPAVPGWLVGLFAAIVAAAPAVAVAVPITGPPVSPLAVARAVSVRAVVPRVQEVTVATPLPVRITGGLRS